MAGRGGSGGRSTPPGTALRGARATKGDPVSIDLNPEPPAREGIHRGMQYASQSVERTLRRFEYMTNIGTREVELGQVSLDEVDEQWVRDRLAHRLIYDCEPEG